MLQLLKFTLVCSNSIFVMNANKCQIIYSIIYIQRFTVYFPHLIIPFESPFHFIRPIFNAFEKYAQTPMNLVYCMQQVFFLHTTIKQVSRRCVGKSVEQSDDDIATRLLCFVQHLCVTFCNLREKEKKPNMQQNNKSNRNMQRQQINMKNKMQKQSADT